jgi:hypothetical protein
MKLYYESKIYIFFVVLSSLFLMLKEDAKLGVLTSYIIMSIFGIRTINCYISGGCFRDVYYFLILYILLNVVFVLYYEKISKYFPNVSKSIKNKQEVYKEKGIINNLKKQKYLKLSKINDVDNKNNRK